MMMVIMVMMVMMVMLVVMLMELMVVHRLKPAAIHLQLENAAQRQNGAWAAERYLKHGQPIATNCAKQKLT